MHIIIGYIYIVKYSDARTVKITKPEEKSMKSFDKKEIEKLTQRRVVGKKEFDVYKTDIKTMFDDTIQTKSNDLPTAINVNGRTLVLFSALGKHFGKVEYNDEQRVASIWDGGEEDVISTEKIYVEELGVSYQKTGRFDLSGWSILKSQYCNGVQREHNKKLNNTGPKSGRSEWAAPFSWKGGMIFGYHNFVTAPCGRRRNDC